MQTFKPTVLLLLFLLPPQVTAMDSDRDQAIEVEADRLEVREQEHISIYEGNVKLVQGSLNISSERLVIHFNDANELTLMEMTGRPARFRQLDNNRQEMLGEAEQIDYTESESLLELRRSAYYSHAGDVINSDLIRINTDTNGIQAGGTQSDERVKMVINPRQNQTPDAPVVNDQATDEP
ncbi:MAG: lipopolysaccharide transport periplasmic protein LptA [Gammaproteobacteria bacterium]|jgi:lipopolysaccharide export system protein LptA|nr:lipopolysaccharide transport periplasmic protein LptA [Gammaproteobacteria bacterium]